MVSLQSDLTAANLALETYASMQHPPPAAHRLSPLVRVTQVHGHHQARHIPPVAGLTLARERLTMDVREGDVIDMALLGTGLDARSVNGAVAELTARADGTIAAEIRIPGPKEG